MNEPLWVQLDEHPPVPYEAENSLLDCLESNGLQLPYNCRNGYCGCCKVRLLAGEVIAVQQSLVELQANEILACSCRPLTSVRLKRD